MTMVLLTLLLLNVVALAIFGLSRSEDDSRTSGDESFPASVLPAADSAFHPTAL